MLSTTKLHTFLFLEQFGPLLDIKSTDMIMEEVLTSMKDIKNKATSLQALGIFQTQILEKEMYTDFVQTNFDLIVEDVVCSIIQHAKKTNYFEFVTAFVEASSD